MASLPLHKFGENLPVSGFVAVSQAAVGVGIGLLIADKLQGVARQRTAAALIGAGVAAVVPFVLGVIAEHHNRPTSTHRMQQRLEAIRRSTRPSNDFD